jgi:hypothetical protein
MAKSTSNAGKPVTAEVIKQVRELARGNTPTRVIGIKIGRSDSSVRSIAQRHGISLAPTNRSPYGAARKK